MGATRTTSNDVRGWGAHVNVSARHSSLRFGAIPQHTYRMETLYPIPREIFEELNAVRTNPASLVPALLEWRKGFNGNVAIREGKTTNLKTLEGTAAIDECIGYLQKAEPLPAFLGEAVQADPSLKAPPRFSNFDC